MSKKKRKKKSDFSKLEFAQKITCVTCIFSLTIVPLVLIGNFILLWFNKQSMSQETVTVISVYGAITSTMTFGGYAALTAVRACSKNKHGVSD